jgi:hypothetical protein
LPLKGLKQETIVKIPGTLRHRTYSSSRQPEIGKTRVNMKIPEGKAISRMNVYKDGTRRHRRIPGMFSSYSVGIIMGMLLGIIVVR